MGNLDKSEGTKGQASTAEARSEDWQEMVIDGYPVMKYYRYGSSGLQGAGYKHGLTALKRYLVDKYKQCYFCAVPVIIHQHQDGRGLPDNAATIDHLIPRPQRKRFGIVEKVLACHKCNYERNELVQNPRRRASRSANELKLSKTITRLPKAAPKTNESDKV